MRLFRKAQQLFEKKRVKHDFLTWFVYLGFIRFDAKKGLWKTFVVPAMMQKQNRFLLVVVFFISEL